MNLPVLTSEDILTALRLVTLPGSVQNIVEAGRVSGITIRGTHVGFVLETDAASAASLEEACRRALLSFPDIEKVSVVTTGHTADITTTPAPKAETKKASYSTVPVAGVARIIAIASGKGGVGKSSLTMLLAHALAARGESVGIVDADIHGPSVPRMLGLEPTPPAVKDGLMLPAKRYGIMANSIGLVGGDTAAIWRGPMVTKALHQLLRGTDWRSGKPTTLLIDLPPGTGDIQLTLMQSVPVSAAIIITTPQEIALADARKAASMFRKINVPILGIVENMSYFTAPDGTQHQLFGQGGGTALAASFHVPLMAQLPLDPAIGQALDTGDTPLTEALHTTLTPLLDVLLQA